MVSLLKDVSVQDFSHLLVDNRVEEQINRIITIYDGMKYDLENVPTALQARDIESMLEIKSVKNIKKVITKLYRKELDKLLMAEIRKLYPVETKPLDNRSGLFDENGDLVYGKKMTFSLFRLFISIFFRFMAQFNVYSNQPLEAKISV